MAERPLYTLYKNLKAQNYDVPDDYNKFESALTRDGKGGADNRHAIYENLKAQNFDVPDSYERFYSALFEPRSKTSSRAKGGSVPMTAADRTRFSAGAQAILNTARQVKRASGNIRKTVEQAKKFNANDGKVTIGFKNPLQNQNVQKNEFNYNSTTGKTGTYTTTDGVEFDNEYDATQYQNQLDEQGEQYINAVNAGEIPSALDVRDKNGNYDLQENIGKNGTYLTEEGAQKQFDNKLADAYARKKEIEAAIAEDHRLHGNPLLSYGASIGGSNGRTAEQNDYSNKLATSLALVNQQIGALEAVKQYPTSSWGEDALKALDNTAFTAKTWDFGLTDFATMGQMERIKTKMDNNIPLSGSDKMLLKSKLGADAAAALEDEKMGNIYRWTKIAGQSLPFMLDFFMTGGYGGITKGIIRGALKFAAKRGMGKVSAAILKNTGIVAGDVIGSYAMAGTEQALKTGADIMQRHLGNLYQDEKGDYKFGTFDENGNLLHEGGESMGTALYKGLTSAMVENYTEKLFGHNYGIKRGAVNFMEKHGMNASAEFFKNIGKSGWYTNSKKWMEKFGINGFAEEVMEEEIGIPLHALLDGEGKVSDLLDTKQQLDIIGGMAISVGSMYAMGAGSRPVKGIYNRAQYYRFRNKVNVADTDAENLLGDNWTDIKDKIDNATNEQMGSVLAGILRQRDTMTKEQINAAVNYGVNLMKMRGYNIAKTAEMNAREITNEPTTPDEQHQTDIDNAYSEGHDADDADKHDIQIQQEDQMKTLAAALGISEQQLSAMSDDELESLTGQDDKLDQAIYDYQLSSARYQGVVDDAQDKVDLAAHQAEQRVDMYTDQNRGSVRNATIKASGGLEDYGVYIISGNVATHEDGSIDVSNSDDMILYYDPTTNSVEHADAMMFAELGEELPADDVKTQAVADAKENAIKEIAGIIDGTVEVGSQFSVTGADGTEHTYEVLADYGDGTAAISIDGNVVENPYSLADLQQMKDLEDQKRLEAAKAEREQMEKERAEQQTQEVEEAQPSFDFNQILNDNGNVVLVDVLDKDGNTKYPDSKLFLIRDTGAKAKVIELKSDGTIIPHAVNKEDVATISSMSLDEYKQAMPETSMIEDNSGEESDEDSQLANLGLPKGSEIWMSGDGFGRPKENTLSKVVGIDEQGSIILEDKDGKKWSASFDYINNHRELPPLDENTNIVNEENNQSESNTEENTPAPEQTPSMTLEDGTEVPMLEDGNPDFSKLTAEQTAELYDTQFGEDADGVIGNWVSEAKKALDKANNMAVKGKNFVEQKAAKDAKEKAIADAQAAYDSAIAIRDAYNERQLAKVEDTAEGRKNLIEKARRKFARLKSAVKDDAEAVSQLYRETIGSLLHRLYDGTGIDVTDTTPLTAEEYVASNLGAHSLNYEGNETSKGVKQETGLSREDFAKTQLLAADGKGTTIDALVHSLWENRPSNLDSLDTQDIRNALIGVLNSGFKASEARNFVENIRIAQAENILEEQKRAQENATYAEQQKAEQEAELKAKSDEKAELKAKSEAKLDNESSNESNDLDNDLDNEKTNDKINDNINTPEDATDDAPLGAERDESDLPFSARDNGTQQTTAERAADVEKNKVDDMKVVDNIVGKKTRKTLEKLAKMMGANVQWQYSDKNANGWFDDKTNTIYLTLDSSITEGVQFIFGHEMTHEMRTKNPAAYEELKTLVKDMMGEDAFNKETDRITSVYNENNVFYNGGRTAYEEEVVADQLGKWIRDVNYAHTLLLKMSHPLLARLHEIVNRFLMALHGIEISDDMNLILRSIEQAYVKTAKGEVTNTETGEDVSFSLRQKPEPKKKGIGYKVFVLKDGKLYPPMVANPDGAATPVGVWLDADAAPIAGESKTGRPQVKQGGKGTQGGSGKLAYRPGWHLGVVPYAIQFNRKDAEGNKTLFPKNFVFAEVEYAADVDYQEEARQEGINPSGKYQHSLAGLKHLPTDGYYMYRTNPNPETDPWVITGAMKVNRILTRAEQAELVKNAGREPQQIQEGDIVTDDVVNSINQEIAAAPKFSLKVYHGSGADFTEFDFDHMGEGAGSQAFGWGGYVTSSKKIGKSYATMMDNDPSKAYYRIQRSNGTRFAKKYPTLESFLHGDKQIAMNDKFTEQEKIDFYNEMKKLAEPYHNLYEVDIPEDNGSNYLDWDSPITDELIDKVAKALPSLRSYDIKDLKKDRTFDNFYKTISMRSVTDDASFNDDKAASKLLSSLGYTGIKYKAGRNFGGAEEGDTNYVIFKPEDMRITEHTKFSLKSKPVRFEAGKKLSDEEKKEVLSTLKDAYKVNGVPYHIEETAGGKEKRVYEPTADSYIVSDITNRPLRYYITLPDGRVAHPTEVYPNISDNEVKSSATKQGLLDDEVDQIVGAAIGKMKDIADNAKAVKVLTELQNLPHETHDVGYGLNHARSYNYKTGIFTSDAAQAIDYVVRRMRRKEDVPAEIPAALKKAVADSYGMVDNLIDGMSSAKFSLKDIEPVGKNQFGDVYDQFKGKPKEAFDFLLENKDGYLKGVFHRDEIGDIDLAYGSAPNPYKGKGLAHIIRKHVETLHDFPSIDDAINTITDVISNGVVKDGSIPNTYDIENGDYRVVVAADKNGNWVLTAFDYVNPTKKKKKGTATALPPSQSSDGAGAVAPNLSAAKIDNSSETTKKNGEKFSLKDEKIKSVAEKFGVNEDDVAMYANAVEKGSTAEAARARANIKRYLLQVNEGNVFSFKDIIKYTKPVNEALKENFGDLDAMIEERRKQVEAERNAMEAARKRAQEEEEKRQKHLEELSLIPTDELDKRYMDAIANKDESTAREMLDESARRKGYDDADSDYQGQGAWAAPSNPQYESDKERRADIDNAPDVNLEDIALGYSLQPDDYFSHPERYSQNTPHGLESVKAINTAIDAIKNGEKDVKVKVYRAVPTSVKEGKLRNGDWVTPSKKYAEMHGDHRLEGKYRIIEDEVPANQLWWDGNDANEFGFDDGKEYRYKNAKNNRKLNDLITYDNKGNVIPPSKRFNSRKNDIRFSLAGERGAKLASRALSEIGFVGIKYPAGMIHGGAEEADYNYVIFDENNANIVGNTKFSLRYDQFEHDLNQWKKDNNLPKDAQRPTIPQRNAGESAADFLRRVDEYRKQMALWKTAPTYEQHLLSDDTALGEFNRELQRGSVLKRIAFQDSMLAIRKAQEAIMKEVGVDHLNMAEDAYTAENRSHGKGKNEFEEYNNQFLQPLRKAYHQMKKVLGNSYDNVRVYMMAKHGLERDAQMAFKKSLEADFEDVAQRSAAYKAYKGDMNRIINDSDLEFGRVDFTTWRQRDNALRAKYSPSYMDYRYDKNGIAYDYSGLSALFEGSDFEEAAHKLIKDIEDKYVTETHNLWDATNAATKKILRDSYKAGMMSKDAYQYVRDMYSHYIPLRGWDGTTADQVWDYIGGGKGAFNQTLKTANGRTSIADDPIAYIENMAESGILLNNKNWVKQHLMLLAQNHPTSLLTLSKAWYVKSTDANGNEEWIPATPQITSQMNSNQVKAAIDAFEQKMENMAQTGDATQKRDGLNIAYPQTHSEEREHEVRVMKDGEEYVIYVNGDPQLAQAMNNIRAHRVREIQSGKLDKAAAWLGRKMAAAYTSLSPLFIPSNYFRDLTMTLASTAIREDAKYNYLLRKNLATSWNLGFMLRDYQNGKLREKVSYGNATPKEQMFYDFMMNGGETGFVSSLDVEDLKKKFKNDLKDLDRWKANPVKVGHTIMDAIEFLNRAIEDSNRFAVYMTSIQYGRSIDEAVNDAKDVTLNFNRKGTGEYGWQMVRNLYLFINPAVQSLQTLGALVKHHPFKFTAVTASWLASGVLVPIVNAALMSMLGGDDDKDKYWQFTKWDRRNNLIMWVPFTHEYVKIPLAQEFRAFYGIGDMIASKMMGGELAEESWSQYAEDLLGQVVDMLPLDPTGYDGNIAVSLMPNAIRPVFELAFNVDFTGKPLFKDSEYNKYDPNFTKAYVGTPDWLVRASKMVNSIGNDYPDVQQNSIDAFGDPRYNLNNPAVVDHVLSSYLGGAYTMGSQVLGVLTKALNDPKEIKVADIPLFSKFVSNPDDRPVTKKQGDEFWNMKENHDRAANTLSKLKKQAKVDGDYSMLERFYDSDEYKQYKQDDVKVKKYEEDKKKERAEESGEEYRPHKLNAEDIYKAHATPKDDFEDLKLKQLYTKLNGFKTSYDLLVDTAPSQSDGYYNTNKAAIDAIDEISLDKQEISELKKGFLDDGKDAYNVEDMKRIRELRKKILAVLEKANKVVVANQKAKAEK